MKNHSVHGAKDKPTFKHVKARVDCWKAQPSTKQAATALTEQQKVTTSKRLINNEANAKVTVPKNVEKTTKGNFFCFFLKYEINSKSFAFNLFLTIFC